MAYRCRYILQRNAELSNNHIHVSSSLISSVSTPHCNRRRVLGFECGVTSTVINLGVLPHSGGLITLRAFVLALSGEVLTKEGNLW